MSSFIFSSHPVLEYTSGLTKFRQSFNHIIWHITNRCNLECTYCYTSSSPFEEKEDKDALFDTAEAISIISPLKLSVIGGEPLVVKELPEILRIIKYKSPRTEIHIDTNLSLLTPELYEKLKDVVAYCNTTVDHYIPEKHNTTRGLFHQTVKNIRFLVEKGERVNVVVVVTKVNYRDLDKIVEFLISLGVDKVVLARSKPAGRGLYDINILKGKELKEAIETVSSLVDNKKVFATGWFHEKIPDYYGLDSCYCGVYQFTLNWRGEAVPCESMIHEKGVNLVRLVREGKKREEIINTLRKSFRKWAELTLIYPAVCVECEIRDRCRKSCRYQTLNVSFNPLGRPVYCNIKDANIYDVIGYNYYSPIYPEGKSRWKTYTAFMVERFVDEYGSFTEFGAGGGVWVSFAEQNKGVVVKGYEILPSMIQLWELYKHKHRLRSDIVKRDVRYAKEKNPVIMVDNFITHFDEGSLKALFYNVKGPILLEFTESQPKNVHQTVTFGGIKFEEKMEVLGGRKVKKTVCRKRVCAIVYQYFYTYDDVVDLLKNTGKDIVYYEKRGRWVYIVAE